MIRLRLGLRSSFWLLALALVVHAEAARGDQIAKTERLSPSEEQKKFQVPPGFEIQLVASEPDIHKPLNMAFDRQGRLWVTDTVEYPFPVGEGQKGRDCVRVLTDKDGDGRADEITTFAEGLSIPIGVYPIDRGAIVFSIPNVWRMLDTDGDGRADTKEQLYGPYGQEDTHGLTNSFTRGLDGWLYATHGYANKSTIAGTDGSSITLDSGNVYRMRVDGSRVEYFTHGQVNPFGLVFDPLGNLYSADCSTKPLYLLLRGGCYPCFGKEHDGMGFTPTMMKHNHGSSAIGGVVHYDAAQFPEEYRDNIFVGNPVTGRVNRDRLDRVGSAYEAKEMPDLVVSDDPWFRPVYMQLGPDGAIYIADFYNRIIAHDEVDLNHPGRDRESGRIWRVVYTGKGLEKSPEVGMSSPIKVSDASQEQLIEMLGAPNITVRSLATQELVERVGQPCLIEVISLLHKKDAKPIARAHALWVFERVEGICFPVVRFLARDKEVVVRIHLMKALAERLKWEQPEIVELVRAALKDDDDMVRRAAADALGRHPQAENLAPLLETWRDCPKNDLHLIHTTRMALRDQLAAGLYSEARKLAGDDREGRDQLGDVSLGVATADAADFLIEELKEGRGPKAAYLRHIVRHAAPDQLPAIFALARSLERQAKDQASLALSIAHGARERGVELPREVSDWVAELSLTLLSNKREGEVKSGIELAREFHSPQAFAALKKVAGRDARHARLRQSALDACVANDPAGTIEILVAVITDTEDRTDMRQSAATVLGRINSEASRETLAKLLPTAPEAIGASIAAALTTSPEGAEQLLVMVAAGKAPARFLQSRVVDRRLHTQRIADIDARLEKLTAGLPPKDEAINQLIKHRAEAIAKAHGEPGAGAKVFTKTCATCHRIGDEGGKIGPNLDGIGLRGLDRILEDILDPSRNVDQAFRTVQIVTNDGQIVSGLPLRDEGQVAILADSQGKEISVRKSEIDTRTVSPLSLMPSNIAEQITDADFADLLEYLLTQKQKK